MNKKRGYLKPLAACCVYLGSGVVLMMEVIMMVVLEFGNNDAGQPMGSIQITPLRVTASLIPFLSLPFSSFLFLLSPLFFPSLSLTVAKV